MICSSLLKTLLWVANFVIFAAGMFLIGAGIYVYKEMNQFFAFFDERYANGAIILGIFGAFLSVIGFLGCCGALKKNDCMIYTFAALLAAIVLAEIVGAIYVFAVNPAGTADVIEKNMTEAMKKYGNAQSEGVTIVWNLAQQKLHCCGVTKGEKDWNDKGKPKGVNSCYKDAECKLPGKKPYADCEKGKSSEKYEVGCLTKVEEFVHSEAKFVGGISIGIALIQVLGVVIACKLPKEWQKQG